MTSNPVAGVERRTYHAWCSDGLADILLGCYFLVLAVGLSWNRGWLAGAAGACAFPLWMVLRKVIVEPRMGYAKLHASRAAKLRTRPIVVALIMALVIAAGIIWGGGQIPVVIFPALVFVLPLAAAAHLLEIQRLYLYAAVIAAERGLDYAAGGPYDFPFWPSALVILATGCLLLVRFLRQYPAVREEVGADA